MKKLKNLGKTIFIEGFKYDKIKRAICRTELSQKIGVRMKSQILIKDI